MPTGYTANLYDGEQSFEEFAMGCARAFGALVSMKEDPTDKEIPERFEVSDYHIKNGIEYSERYNELLKYTEDQKIKFGEMKKDGLVKQYKDSISKYEIINHRIGKMKDSVINWGVPSPEHYELKKFMLQQLEISIETIDYYQDELKKIKGYDVGHYYKNELESVLHSINYHKENHEKEVGRIKSRNDWVKALRDSLKSVEA